MTIFDGSGRLRELAGEVAEAVKRAKIMRSVVVEVGPRGGTRTGTEMNRVTRLRIASPLDGRNAVVNYARALAAGKLLSRENITRKGTQAHYPDVPSLSLTEPKTQATQTHGSSPLTKIPSFLLTSNLSYLVLSVATLQSVSRSCMLA